MNHLKDPSRPYILNSKIDSTVGISAAASSRLQTNEINPADSTVQSQGQPSLTATLSDSSFWFLPSISPDRANQKRGRLSGGLGARIGGMDKNTNARSKQR